MSDQFLDAEASKIGEAYVSLNDDVTADCTWHCKACDALNMQTTQSAYGTPYAIACMDCGSTDGEAVWTVTDADRAESISLGRYLYSGLTVEVP